MTSIKRDDSKQQWESSATTEFPLVCETCLGDNPYVRMTKEAHGKKCKICEIPFTVFAWQAGTKGRLKKVEICRNCAKTKNVCQVCIYDLQYGLPVQVRDKVLAEHGGSSSNSLVTVPPQSDANLSWFTQSQERALEHGGGNTGTAIPVLAAAKLQKMARMEPRYERNLAKLCSFFARGECNRGLACPFRHEMPRDRNDPLSKQNTKDRFYGNNDPVAHKMIHGAKERQEKRKAELIADGGDGTTVMGTTLYCRFHDSLHDSNHNINESDIRDKFYSFGEISSVRFSRDRSSVFVEYTSSSAAQLAITSMDKTNIGGAPAYCNWARANKRGNTGSGVAARVVGSDGGTTVRPLLAPGAGNDDNNNTHRNKVARLFTPAVRPSAEVLAAGRAARNNTTGTSLPSGGAIVGVPRPKMMRGVPRPSSTSGLLGRRPYYPSSDPGRLGSRTTTTE